MDKEDKEDTTGVHNYRKQGGITFKEMIAPVICLLLDTCSMTFFFLFR